MAAFTDSLTPRRHRSDYWLSNIRPGVAALFLGGAFGAGVYLGNAAPEEAPSLELAGSDAWMAQVDARSEKLDQLRSELQLRYHDELVGPPRDVRDSRRAHHVPKPTPPVLATLEKDANLNAAKSLRERLQAVATSVRADGAKPASAADASAHAEVAPASEIRPDEHVLPADAASVSARAHVESASTAPQAEAQALADQVSLPERAEEEERVRSDDAAEDIESIEDPREKTPQDSKRIENALARVLGTGAPEPHAAPASATHSYYVQVAATPSLDGAQKLVDQLRQAGFAALVIQGEGKDQQAVYRVRVGPLLDREKASARAADVEGKTGLAGFVIRD